MRDLNPKLLCGIGTAERQSQYISCVEAELRNFQNVLGVEYLWFLMQWSERHGSVGPQAPGSKPSWWCCYLLAVAPTGNFLFSPLLSSSNKSAGTKLPTGSAHRAEGEFSTL